MKMKEMKNYHSDGRMIYIPGCQHHIVFSPKYRRNVLIGDIEKILKELIIEKQEHRLYGLILGLYCLLVQ